MTAIALRTPDPDDRDLSSLSVEELKAGLINCLRITAGGLRDAARYVRAMEDKGVNLSEIDELKCGILKWLRLIAFQQLLPEAYVRFYGHNLLLSIISGLPIPTQEHLAAGELVRMVTYTPKGETTFRMVDPRAMAAKQVRQVFNKGEIRDDAAQAVWLDNERRKASQPVKSRVGDLVIDKERGGVMVGRKFIPEADLRTALKALQ